MRVLRTVLRETGGEVPLVYSPFKAGMYLCLWY
jgi:hypothetical protein